MTTTHSGIWGEALVESLRKQGLSDAAIVGNTGIDLRSLNGDDPRMSFEHLALLFERAEELAGDDLVGLKLGSDADFRRWGLIAYTGMSSPTVRTLLRNLVRYQRIVGEVVEFNAEKLDAEGGFAWHYQVLRDVKRDQYIEFGSAMLIATLRRLTNRRLTPTTVEFKHYRKANAKALSAFFGCTVAFGARENRITFKSADLDLALNTADDHLFRILRKVSKEAVNKTGVAKTSLVVSVEECIAAEPSKSQAEVAKEMGMSARTLARRLADEGTAFSEILHEYREAVAKSMLTDTDLPVTEIAFVLGYSSPSTFSTAFRGWTGNSPNNYRSQSTEASGP